MNRRTFWRFLLGLAVSIGGLLVAIPATVAQRARPDGVWQQVYQRLPDLPRGDQYINRETGKVDSSNTLVGRIIRYHLYVKNRSPLYRLDWKLTIADYLGVNEAIDDEIYPGKSSLRQNPVEADTAIIRRLSRTQREALIQAILEAFTLQTHLNQPSAAPR